MASAKPYLTIFSLLFIILSLFPSLSLSESSSSPTVFDLLPKYGLPIGLLPDCVTNYTLSDTGHFTIDLEHTCYIEFDYLAYYDTHISGTVKFGSISNLKGIQVKQFFWFNLDEVRVDEAASDYIYFQVGIVTKKLNIHQFEYIHSCRAATTASQFRPFADQELSMVLIE